MSIHKCAALVVFVSLIGVLSATVPTQSGRTSGGLVTLYANDDLRSTLSFENGEFAARIVEGELILDDTDILFDALEPNHMSFGYVRNQLSSFVNLGDFYVPGTPRPLDDAPKPAISVFHTLHVDDAQVSYTGGDGRKHRLREANSILHGLPTEEVKHFEPKIGFTYLIRHRSTGRDASDLTVKLQVVDFLPGHSVTFRWGTL